MIPDAEIGNEKFLTGSIGNMPFCGTSNLLLLASVILKENSSNV